MRIPLIVVKRKGSKNEEYYHVVGDSIEDHLYIDHSTGGIHYRNLVNREGTNAAECSSENSYYEFNGFGIKSHEEVSIEFVPIEKYIKMVNDENKRRREY